MKYSTLKYQSVIEIANNKSLGIQTIGENNDFYQVVRNIVGSSVTGLSCVGVYADFLTGMGLDNSIYAKEVNSKGLTLDALHRSIVKDYALYNGFAVHINYNALGQKVGFSHVPFEHIRFALMDNDGNFSQVALHSDWAREFSKLKKFKKEDIDFIDLYNPDTAIIEQQADNAGGWDKYKGQIFYFSGDGDKTYPIPLFAPALTDMSSDEGLSNITYRNIRNRFMSGGVVVGVKGKSLDNTNTDDSEGREEDDTSAIQEQLIGFQGDEEACKIAYMEVESKEDMPEFLKFESTNYDKDYNKAEKSVKDKIGRAFKQPPILRAEDIGAGFGAELMQSSYKYYNSITNPYRVDVERAMTEIFANWAAGEVANFAVQPLKWDEA